MFTDFAAKLTVKTTLADRSLTLQVNYMNSTGNRMVPHVGEVRAFVKVPHPDLLINQDTTLQVCETRV